MQKEIKQTWQFNQSPREVWDYLTKPELIEQWLMKTDFQPIAGHKFCFSFTPKADSKYEGRVECEVLEIKPFTRLSYSWNGRTLDKSRSFHSVVTWTLVSKGKGTELFLQHDGLEVAEDILNHEGGWKSCLKRFDEQINTVKNETANP